MIHNQSKYHGITKFCSLLAVVILIVVCGPNEINSPKATAPQTGNGSSAIDHQPQSQSEAPKMSIIDAKNAWEAKLMSIPGVTGVAIGLSAKGDEKVVKVYVSKTGHVAKDQIPARIEGFIVEIEPRSTFKVY